MNIDYANSFDVINFCQVLPFVLLERLSFIVFIFFAVNIWWIFTIFRDYCLYLEGFITN